jgi:N-acetylneuraminic acid mutarotase
MGIFATFTRSKVIRFSCSLQLINSATRYYSGAAACPDGIYITGGYSTENSYLFDVIEKTYRQLPSPHIQKRRELKVASVNNKLYAVGGESLSSRESGEVYDPETDSWAMISPPIQKLHDHASVAIGKYIYFIGGTDTVIFFAFCQMT